MTKTNYFLNRKGENGVVPFRSGRFYCVGNEWYFAVRRGMDQGPFTSQEKARESLVNYINDQLAFERHLEQNKAGLTLENTY